MATLTPLLRPWGSAVKLPSGREVLDYIDRLYEHVCWDNAPEHLQVMTMKRYLNHIGSGVEATGQFLHDVRRVTTKADFTSVCRAFLDHDRELPLEPML